MAEQMSSDNNAQLNDVHIPVLIVGAGPSGATTAFLLGKLGIPSIAICRHAGTANTPRAHIFNQRAMEVLRDGGLEEQMKAVATPSRHMMHTSWSHSLGGEEYGRMYAWGNAPDRKGAYEAASPCKMSDLPQSRLEPILVAEAKNVGADFRFYTEFVSQSTVHNGTHIETTVKDRESGQHYRIRSRYLIGCDGARSMVLNSVDIPIDGHQLNSAFNVHIKADLSRYLEARPGSLNWVLNPDAPHWSATGNFRMVRPWNEFVVSMHPSGVDGKSFEPTEKDILERLRQMIGPDSDDIPIQILSSFRWTINDQVARTWQKGNVICIGDATHRHPPINGLGSNTCISDAMNLAWKLAYVLKGIAHADILDSITVERKPVGDGVVRRANEGMKVHRRLWNLIGLSAEERAHKTKLMSEASPEGAELRLRFREALEQTDDEFHALGIQMNQIYCDSPLVIIDSNDSGKPDISDINLLKDVVISTYPGFHLPHVWVAKNGQSPRQSTLDLCGHGAFTILTGIGGEVWRTWSRALEVKRPGLEISVHSIGWRQDYMDAYREWETVRGVDDDGAVLVRPDHFVAWRCKSATLASAERLEQVFDSILPRP